MLGIIGRCGNINGRRSANLCSHSTGALLYFNKIIRNEIIDDPTPLVTERLKNIKNPGAFVDQFKSMDHHDVKDYMNDKVINGNFINPDDPKYYQHTWDIDVSSDDSNDDDEKDQD